MSAPSGPPKIFQPCLVDRARRVVIPAKVAAFLKVGPEDHVAFVVQDGEVHMKKVRWELESADR